MSTLIPGSSWTQIQGRYLLASGTLAGTSETYGATNTVASGLPNITGEFSAARHGWSSDNLAATGAFYDKNTFSVGLRGADGDDWGTRYGYTAYNSNSTFGQSGAVRAPAYVVNVWRRTA